MSYDVRVTDQPRRPMMAVAATTTFSEFPGLWRGMPDEVYAWLRQAGARGGCNVMLYRSLPGDDRFEVQVGVEVSTPVPPSGRVVVSALPEGPAAATTHRGPYGELGAAHQAVRRWCAEQGQEITGENWEVYGDWHEDPAELETEVFYRLRPDSTPASAATAWSVAASDRSSASAWALSEPGSAW